VSTYSEPGAPARDGHVPLSVPEIGGNEWRYVKECLDTEWVSSVGPFVDRFEREIAEYLGAGHAVATVSGTAALHVALLVAGVRPDDVVLVSTLTFIAPVNAIRYAGAWPVFIDAEPDYWQMDPRRMAEFLDRECDPDGGETRHRATGRRVSAILPVHILGHPVDMDPILDLARRYGLRVVEDATEGLGSKYRGRAVGCLGDVGCFSFNGNKIITTGGGGMLVTADRHLAERARYLTTQAKDDPLEYVHGAVGYNYRLTNVQAAIGCAQLERLDEYVAAKRRIAATYAAAFAGVPGVTLMAQAPWADSNWWMYTVLFDSQRAGADSRAVMTLLGARGIQARPLWQPIHRSPAYADLPAVSCPVADRLNAEALSLPCSVGLSRDAQQRVIDTVMAAVSSGAGAQ
jgi:perosamine synthetase